MSEQTDAGFQREGDITFEAEDTGEETTADSSSENDDQGDDTHSDEGESTRSEETTPFHQDPRWKERENDWNRRFNEQETRHQADQRAIREEFTSARKANAETTTKPVWFGGTDEQWTAYRSDRDAELSQAEERAAERVRKDFEGRQTAEDSAVKEATDFMQSEIADIQADKSLNPTGEKIDPTKLFKVVFDNQLVDAKGRWNYRAGVKLMRAEKPAVKPNTQARKEAAAATTSEGKPEAQAKSYTTSKDFETDKPW